MASEVFADVAVLLGGLLEYVVGAAQPNGMSARRPVVQRDFLVCLVMTVLMLVMNWGSRLLFLKRAVRAVFPSMNRSRQVKFVLSVNEVVTYGSFFFIGLCIVPSQHWSWPSVKWWQDHGEHMNEVLYCYYLLYTARYFQAGISVFFDPRRKDFWEMVIHHTVTGLLCTSAYLGGYFRSGLVVMVVFDVADVPLHMAKLFLYTSKQFAEGSTKRTRWGWLANRFFEIFAVIFFVSRIIMFSYICWSAHAEGSLYSPTTLLFWTIIGLGCVLLAIQLFWFGLVVKTAWRMSTGRNATDVRSDDEDEPIPTKKSQ
eukprot:TRINITY_DN5530_c0_g1_i3.p1 TRINITY_DN5530_c0_g1~~TRINITY_DN5530_c0_g1_i3.p1  ORF type:complete len:330 (+),score=34.38 TRINITY_DN5530_c0_g1_i3:52-990(+)